MGKYSEELRIANKNTSDHYILTNILPNKTILEFGSASGRMTKYLKEELNCEVYIVEYTKEDFLKALEYAKDGICGDILEFLWEEKFKDVSFDYILFADVLEHLIEPEEVIVRAKKLLKYDGAMFISVPNVAHNSIIINLLNNKFDYTNTGILDKTHVRLFTSISLETMINDCGLFPVEKYSTNMSSYETEFKNTLTDDNQASEIIKQHENGGVYQFIFKCVTSTYYRENRNQINIIDSLKREYIENPVALYYDSGYGFQEASKLMVNPIRESDNTLMCQVEFPVATDTIRFDPTEDEKIILYNLNIYANGASIRYQNINGFKVAEYDVFLDSDPQILIKLDYKVTKIAMTYEAYVFDSHFIDVLLKRVSCKEKTINDMDEYLCASRELIEKQQLENSTLQRDFDDILKKCENLQMTHENLQINHGELLKDNKELLIKNEVLQCKYDEINNSRIWRFFKPIRKKILRR